jgi:hypothetical protein
MGVNRRNVEAVTDYADGRHFLRLHRDILLPAEVCEAVRRHLAAGRWPSAWRWCTPRLTLRAKSSSRQPAPQLLPAG